MRNAVVLVPRDKDYMGVFFDDKGLRLEVTSDAAIISTAFHRHVFSAVTATGYSRPFLYTKRVIELANANDCTIKDEKGNVTRSLKKLLETLKADTLHNEDFHLAFYYDLWCYNIFMPLYSIDENASASYIVHEEYLHHIARNEVILSEKKEDITYREYEDRIQASMNGFINDELGKVVVFPKKSDEERVKEEVDAMNKDAADDAVNESETNANDNG